MSGYIGGVVPVAMAEPSANSVETQDLKDNAVTDDKINSAALDKAVLDIETLEVLALSGL